MIGANHKYQRSYRHETQLKADKELIRQLLRVQGREKFIFLKRTRLNPINIWNRTLMRNRLLSPRVRNVVKDFLGIRDDLFELQYRSPLIEQIEKGTPQDTRTFDDILADFGLEEF